MEKSEPTSSIRSNSQRDHTLRSAGCTRPNWPEKKEDVAKREEAPIQVFETEILKAFAPLESTIAEADSTRVIQKTEPVLPSQKSQEADKVRSPSIVTDDSPKTTKGLIRSEVRPARRACIRCAERRT